MPDQSDRAILENEICRLQQEISRLHLLLDEAGICYDPPHVEEEPCDTIAPVRITEEHARLLYSIFKGRRDVYSRRGLRKDGGSSYFTQCDNFWKYLDNLRWQTVLICGIMWSVFEAFAGSFWNCRLCHFRFAGDITPC